MENKNTCELSERTQDDCRCGKNGCVNSRFTLAVIAVILSCFTGFWSIPMALAALILSLRAQDLTHDGRVEEARRTAWAGLFGWLTILVALLPVVLIIFFGGAIVAFFAALLASA